MDARGAVRLAGKVTNPEGTERLHQYWVHGDGAAKIRWGEPGDFDRCVLHLGKYIRDPQGYCNLAHKAALGFYPATHAKMEHAGRAAMATPEYDPDGLDASWDGDGSALPDLTGLGIPEMEAAEQAAGVTPPDGPAQRAAKLGGGARFKALSAKLAAKGAADPDALAAWIGRRKYGKAAFHKLAAKARAGGGSASRSELFRSYPLEDAHIVRTGEGDGSGRVVEAYCAVFDDPVEIHDHQGDYEEEIDRAAFNKRIEDVRRSRSGFALVKCMYNHAMTIHGTPSEKFSTPCAVTEHISAEGRGVLTRARYLNTPLGDEVLELWRSGAISAQSFTGAIIRSSPQLRRGDKYRPRDGQLQRVRRLELGLREFGGTPFAAYENAQLVGVRMSPLGTFMAAEHEESEEALPPDEEAAAGEPLARTEGDEHSARYHQHALYRLRSEELRQKAGLVW